MSDSITSGCRLLVRRVLIPIPALLLLIGIITGLYSAWYTNQTENRYPPDSFVTVEGVRLHYHEAGQGTPVLVIHGGGGTLHDFTLSPLYDLLIADHHLICVDRPGLGYSERPDEDPTITVQARLIHGLVEALDLNAPIIVGQSWGAGVAMAYAVAFPDDVSGIVMLGGHPYQRAEPREISAFDRAVDSLIKTPGVGWAFTRTLYTPVGAAIIGPAILDDASIVAPLDERPEPWRDASLRLSLRPSHVQAFTWERYKLDATLADVAPQYNTLDLPVVYVVGALDTNAYEQYQRLLEDIPDTVLIELEDAEHNLWFAYPQTVVEAIEVVQSRVEE